MSNEPTQQGEPVSAFNCIDTSKSKLEKNYKPVKILGLNKHEDELVAIVQVSTQNGGRKRIELLPTKYLKEKHPLFLLDYYISKLQIIPPE